MAPGINELVLPRPGGQLGQSKTPIPGPTEAAFTNTFGKLLPSAKFLNTTDGKAAYYEFEPSTSDSTGSESNGPDRVLLIHGIQTPALGMLPLARAIRESSPKAHIILLELWGHGLSDTPVLPHTSDLFHRLLDDLLDHLNWPSAHILGYSFGAMLTAGYVASRTSRVQSFTLVAPAGFLRLAGFTPEEQAHLRGGDEVAARDWIFYLLEGGEIVLPADTKERIGRGEIIPEAIRDWEIREHPGHVASVVSMFRDGGVIDNDGAFSEAASTGVPSLVVLADKDIFNSEQELKGLGFANIVVVSQAGHGVVREKVPEVAASVNAFWSGLSKT